jgi:GNAT superfamily N-acetyltransferase
MQKIYEVNKEAYSITTDVTKLNIDVIHKFLCEESYWAKGIPKNIVKIAIANSLCFGLFYNAEQIGFARLVTDKATFAYLADVFILQDHRGKGLSKWLMHVVQAHPELQNLRRWLLTTKDAHGLYEQFGWQKPSPDYAYRFMMRHYPDVYNKPVNS